MNLYQDQVRTLANIRQAFRDGFKAPLLVAPTGFGKTVCFAAITQGAAAKGNRVMILVHRQELIDQVSETLLEFGVQHGVIAAGYASDPRHRVQVASVFSLVRRVRDTPVPDLMILDEAHHARLKSTWGKIISAFGAARLLGVTATPTRLSGEGLGDIFDTLVVGPHPHELVDAGRLSPVRVFAPPTIDTSGVRISMGDFAKSDLALEVGKPKVVGDAIDHYQQHTPGQRAAVFCVSLDHCRQMQNAAQNFGISAAMIDGAMDRTLRRQIITEFKNGRIKWLVSCDLISEGFDCPGIEVGISLRPTQSLGLWLQQCGRILRVFPGKSHATILDHSGNCLRHGLPTEQREWSLAGSARSRGAAKPSLSVRVCPFCWSAQKSGTSVCRDCGKPFPVKPRVLRRESGTLEEVTPEELAARRERQKKSFQVHSAQTLETLTALARMRNYKNPEGWAAHVLAGRAKKRQSV